MSEDKTEEKPLTVLLNTQFPDPDHPPREGKDSQSSPSGSEHSKTILTRFPRKKGEMLLLCGALLSPTILGMPPAKSATKQHYRCGQRLCPKCESWRRAKFIKHVRPLVTNSMTTGSNAFSIVMTIPKEDRRPSENVLALRGAWRELNKRQGLAGIGKNQVGWLRVGEMGKFLSPHYHILLCATPEAEVDPDRLQAACKKAVVSALGWPQPAKHMQAPVQELQTKADVEKYLDYLGKGDPIALYTPAQLRAYEIATRGWHNLGTSKNWSMARGTIADQSAACATESSGAR